MINLVMTRHYNRGAVNFTRGVVKKARVL